MTDAGYGIVGRVRVSRGSKTRYATAARPATTTTVRIADTAILPHLPPGNPHLPPGTLPAGVPGLSGGRGIDRAALGTHGGERVQLGAERALDGAGGEPTQDELQQPVGQPVRIRLGDDGDR